jgi:hypothetical protein
MLAWHSSKFRYVRRNRNPRLCRIAEQLDCRLQPTSIIEGVLEKIWNARTQELFEAAVQVTVALAASRAVLQVRENRSDLRDVLRAEMLAGISAMLGSLGAADHWQENAADWANALAETILHDMTVKPEPPACCD